MAKASSQKFIQRNRAPRVQIEYDVELYGSEKKVQLPFVVGVMSDLAGKSDVPQPAIDDRKFLEIDADNINLCLRAGVNVIEQDMNKGLSNFESNSFDTILLAQTLQTVARPDILVEEMLRIGRNW